MICCKVIADYRQTCQQFAKILNDLGKIGDVMWNNNYFYFANTDNAKIGDKNIKKIFKKYGINSIFIEQYNKDYQPHETDEVNIWVEDKLIKIGYVEFEVQEQSQMQFISQQLTDIQNILDQQIQKTSQSQTEEN